MKGLGKTLNNWWLIRMTPSPTMIDLRQNYGKLRKIEAELQTKGMNSRQCIDIFNTQQKTELAGMKDLLQRLNDRIDKLEKDEEIQTATFDIPTSESQTRGQRIQIRGLKTSGIQFKLL